MMKRFALALALSTSLMGSACSAQDNYYRYSLWQDWCRALP